MGSTRKYYHNQVNNCLFDFDQSSEQLFYLKLENFVIANLIDWFSIIGMNSSFTVQEYDFSVWII
jgi:hypothetical protein